MPLNPENRTLGEKRGKKASKMVLWTWESRRGKKRRRGFKSGERAAHGRGIGGGGGGRWGRLDLRGAASRLGYREGMQKKGDWQRPGKAGGPHPVHEASGGWGRASRENAVI